MKLSDIFGDEAKYVQHIDNYVHYYQRSKYLNAAFAHLMKKPEYVYNGTMFRALSVSTQTILNTPDIRMMTAHMHKYANKHQHKTVFAWSKIIGDMDSGMVSALIHQTKYNKMSSCGIILTQHAEGLDINELFKKDDHHSDWFIKEQEVLAQISNDVNVYGFWIGYKVYPVEEFQKFIQDVKKDSQIHESYTVNNIQFKVPGGSEEFDEVEFQLKSDKEKPFLPNWVRTALTGIENEKLFRLKSRRDGTIINITPEEQLKIGNTGDSWEDSHWKPDSIERVPKLFNAGGPITMPTILVNRKTGEKWLLGGHHRLTYNAQVLKNTTLCWGIKVL